MEIPSIIAIIGGIALLLALFGGGIRVKEFEIPSMSVGLRVLSAVTGIVLLFLGVRLYSAPPAKPLTTPTPRVVDIPTSISLPTIVISQIQATNTLDSTPTGILTATTDTSLYDDFNAAHEGGYDGIKWFLDTSAGNVFQQDGALAIEVDGSKGRTTSLQVVLPNRERKIEFPMFFEAQVKVDKPQSGYVYILLITHPSPSGLRIDTDCEAGGSSGAAFGCGYHNDYHNGDSFDDYLHLPPDPAEYGKWHKFRIEIDPLKMTINHYIDGVKTNSDPIHAEKLDAELFTFEIGFYNAKTDQVYVGYVDNVRIGKIGE